MKQKVKNIIKKKIKFLMLRNRDNLKKIKQNSLLMLNN